MVKYLVTGGCGFIGSHLVDLLIERGHTVSVLDDLSNSTEKYLSQKATVHWGSILDDHILKQALKGVQGVFHLAACVSVPGSIQHWYKNHLINCAGSVRLIEMTRGIPLIYASSSAIYGDNPHLPQQEKNSSCPLSPYAVDKLAGEMHAQLSWDLYRTPSIAFRFFNVYGPRQNPNSPYSGVISKFTNLIKDHLPLLIYGDGNQRRDFIYVKDVVTILAKAISSLSAGAHVYNLCSGKDTSINELADLMGTIAGVNVEKHYLPARPGEIAISIGDPSKLLKEQGLEAKTPLSEGLASTMNRLYSKEGL